MGRRYFPRREEDTQDPRLPRAIPPMPVRVQFIFGFSRAALQRSRKYPYPQSPAGPLPRIRKFLPIL